MYLHDAMKAIAILNPGCAFDVDQIKEIAQRLAKNKNIPDEIREAANNPNTVQSAVYYGSYNGYFEVVHTPETLSSILSPSTDTSIPSYQEKVNSLLTLPYLKVRGFLVL
jgi:hypothetical protein